VESGNKKWMVPFFTIWTGQQLSIIGSRAAQFALVWWLTLETGSATVLATASLVALGPQILLGPFVGALVDRWNRRVVMIVSDSFIALVGLWLAFLFWSGTMEVWHVYIVMLAFHDSHGARETLHANQRAESDHSWIADPDRRPTGSPVVGPYATAWRDAG